MQYIIPYLQAREVFQFHVIIWSLGAFGRTKKNINWMIMMMKIIIIIIIIIINSISTEQAYTCYNKCQTRSS